jgi:hypothetical protein
VWTHYTTWPPWVQLNKISTALTPVATLCVMLAAWLNLHVGISRNNSGVFLKALGFILFTTIDLIFGVLRASGFRIDPP